MAEPAVTTQSALSSASAAPPSTETGTSQSGNPSAPPVEDFKSKYTELEGRYKAAEEDSRALGTFRQLVARYPELKDHITARFEGRDWSPRPVTPLAQQPSVAPAVPAIPKEIQDRLGIVDQVAAQMQQLQRAQTEQVEGSKLDKEMAEVHASYPVLKDPKMADLLMQRMNSRVMDIAREFRRQDQFTPNEQIIEAAWGRLAQVPYRSLVWDLMEKELAQHVAEQTFKGARIMQNPGGRGDRVVSQPAGQSPDADGQFEKEMREASSGRNLDHGKRAEAMIRRGLTPRDLGWSD